MSKPTLESRLLHLYKSDKTESGYVILLDKVGAQYGSAIFDLKSEDMRKCLQENFDRAYETDEECYARQDKQAETREQALFEKAEKFPESEWGNGVFLDDNYYCDIEYLHEDLCMNGIDVPQYVWAAKEIQLRLPDASDIVDRIFENIHLDDYPEASSRSARELDEALLKFYNENKVNFTFLEPDYSKAILLEKPLNNQ
jgi:hypothetical protein